MVALTPYGSNYFEYLVCFPLGEFIRANDQRDWLAKIAFSSTNHVAEFCVRANKFA